MALNPFREALGQAGLHAYHHESTFKADADGALARFQTIQSDLERQVRRGDLTLKVAREKANAAVAQLRNDLRERAEGHSSVSRVFLDRLVEASNARMRARERMSLEQLQRETIKLLRMSLIEQQMQTRSVEFEGKVSVRPMTGGPAAPTLQSLLSFHEMAGNAGDEAAREWARRQLEGCRSRAIDPDDQRKIDVACDRPDTINPRLVANYVESLQNADDDSLETFANEAIGARDANACVAAFVIAREAPQGVRARWVRTVLGGLNEYPDAALATLRTLEAEARNEDSEGARAHAEFAIAVAETRTRLPGLETPSEAEIARQARILGKPIAQPGEPIGLALDRRGATAEEFESMRLAATDFEE